MAEASFFMHFSWQRFIPLVAWFSIILMDLVSAHDAHTDEPRAQRLVTLLGPVVFRTTQVPVFTLPPNLIALKEVVKEEKEEEAPKPALFVANPPDEDETKGRRVRPGQSQRRKTKARKKLGRKSRKSFSRRLLTTTEDPIRTSDTEFDDDGQWYEDGSRYQQNGDNEHIDIGVMDSPVVKLMSQKILSDGEEILEELEDDSNLDDNNVDSGISSSRTIEDICESMRKATSQFENWAREICLSMRGTPIAMQMITLLLLGIGSLIVAFLGLFTYKKYTTMRRRVIHKKLDEKSDHMWEV